MSPLDSRALAYDADSFDLGSMLVAIENDAIYWTGGWIPKGSVSAADATLGDGKNFA